MQIVDWQIKLIDGKCRFRIPHAAIAKTAWVRVIIIMIDVFVIVAAVI